MFVSVECAVCVRRYTRSVVNQQLIVELVQWFVDTAVGSLEVWSSGSAPWGSGSVKLVSRKSESGGS